jgi:hypothetical protein
MKEKLDALRAARSKARGDAPGTTDGDAA